MDVGEKIKTLAVELTRIRSVVGTTGENVVAQKVYEHLAQLDIRFAYDDFGAGQARLLELADVPAHFIKFDMALIRDLHKASPRKRQLVANLVQMVLAAGSVPLAEGVECEEEAQACIDMGFQLIQGYLTGRPIPAESRSPLA